METADRYDIHEAKTQLSRIIERAEQGGEVVISREGRPVAKVIPYRAPIRRTGRDTLRGTLTLSDDREAKRRCYARGGIPLHLLLDRERETATLHSQPEDDDYTESHAGSFGKAIELPAPFGFQLDTAELI